jgi:serine/threonine-protein kinase
MAVLQSERRKMTAASDPLPRAIGRYTIVRELRRGRRSVSYSALDPLMNRQLIIKSIGMPPSGSAERKRAERDFLRQAQVAAKLQHPGIVMVLDAGLDEDRAFLVIERVNGRPLHEMLAQGLRPEFSQCASIGARIADALAFAHASGITHGRLGPQHVYLQADGAPKISGFAGWVEEQAGAAQAAAAQAGESSAAAGGGEAGEAARLRDIQALGQLLFMMLTGRAPAPATLAADAAGERASPTREARPETPEALAQLIDRALRMEGDDSQKSAAALRNSLTAFVWNERSAHVAPHLLGLPLAPPERAPVHVATIPLQEGLAPLAESAPAAAAAAAAAVPAPAQPPATPVAAAARAPAAAGATLAAFERFVQWLRPWAIKYRIALFSVGAFLSMGIFLGVILGNLRHSAAVPPVATANVEAPAAEPQPAAQPAVEGPKTPVSLSIQPWGEVFVDAKPTGVSPPLMQIELSNGPHHIEIRRDPSPAWATDVDVQGTAPLRIEHAFQ